jgi:glycosyltransferase involved in cell wall biosynthesis
MKSSPQVVVVQIGARHHYAIPRMLEKSGHLAVFHTDANGVMGRGHWLRMVRGLRSRGRIGKLVQRIPEGVPIGKIRHTDALLRRRILAAMKLGREPHGYVEDDHLFDRITVGWGFAGADTLYAMQKHGTRLLEVARATGLRVVVDVFITPVAHRIVEDERRRFPDLEVPAVTADALELEDERNRREFACADLLLCPGENVVAGVRHYAEGKDKPVAVVPYGSGIGFEGRRNQPVKGRILFAGTADLRKGIHYLGMAASALSARGWDFRVAGNVADSVRRHPLMKDLNFLGRLPMPAMMEEFLSADLFVLPTLAEGCASVVHEAVMAGCPAVTTAAAGTLVRDVRGGLIVPERDPDALADAIARIVADRQLRADLAESCKTLAVELTEEAWVQRLVAALQR